MEKYSLENLISTLFALGFEQVDSTFLTLILGKISKDKIKEKQFKYEDNEFTIQFQKFVDFDGFVYKLKEGLTLESDTELLKNETYAIKDLFTVGIVNRKLMKYFTNFDFKDIIIHKINLIGIDRIDQMPCLFSNKEKSIMYEMFGIEDMHRQETNRSLQAYDRIYNQESIDINNAIAGLKKVKKK